MRGEAGAEDLHGDRNMELDIWKDQQDSVAVHSRAPIQLGALAMHPQNPIQPEAMTMNPQVSIKYVDL